MCGIAGYFPGGSSTRISRDTAEKMLLSMKDRGPDSEGAWEHPSLGISLLHRRLSIQDLSQAGAQPMHSYDGKCAIVFNGEIYNKEDLRALVADYPYQGSSDTEVLLALYRKVGVRLPELLRGMYAFAIWDEEKQGLFLARDPYGIKPLYIAQTSDGVWFASQVKVLLHAPGVDLTSEPAGHTSYFLWGHIAEPYTLYKGIRSLRSGHSLWLQHGVAPRETEFASLAAALRNPPGSEVLLADALRDSVRAHFLSDVPVSIFLSAGLDSSTVLALAADSLPAASLASLTLGFDVQQGTGDDETREAAQIAAHYQIPHNTQIIGRSDFVREHDRLFEVMDQPSIDGINIYFIAKMAHEAGFKVALSGLGGDELFAGYPSFHEIPRLTSLFRRIPASRQIGAQLRRFIEPLTKRLTSPKYAGMLEYGATVEGAYLLRRSLFMPWEIPELLDQDFAAIGLEALFQSESDECSVREISALPLRAQICYLESTRYMRSRLLRDADWAGMAHSVEIRTPLVDYSLVSELASLVVSSKPPGKLDMAATPHKPLPAEILQRKKTGFTVPVREWLMSSTGQPAERGLRSWAKYVYDRQWSGPAPYLKKAA